MWIKNEALVFNCWLVVQSCFATHSFTIHHVPSYSMICFSWTVKIYTLGMTVACVFISLCWVIMPQIIHIPYPYSQSKNGIVLNSRHCNPKMCNVLVKHFASTNICCKGILSRCPCTLLPSFLDVFVQDILCVNSEMQASWKRHTVLIIMIV